MPTKYLSHQLLSILILWGTALGLPCLKQPSPLKELLHYICLVVWVCMLIPLFTHRGQRNSQGSVFSFHRMGPKDQIQDVRFRGKCFICWVILIPPFKKRIHFMYPVYTQLMYKCGSVGMPGVCLEVTEQLVESGSPFLLCGFQGSNSGCHSFPLSYFPSPLHFTLLSPAEKQTTVLRLKC